MVLSALIIIPLSNMRQIRFFEINNVIKQTKQTFLTKHEWELSDDFDWTLRYENIYFYNIQCLITVQMLRIKKKWSEHKSTMTIKKLFTSKSKKLKLRLLFGNFIMSHNWYINYLEGNQNSQERVDILVLVYSKDV